MLLFRLCTKTRDEEKIELTCEGNQEEHKVPAPSRVPRSQLEAVAQVAPHSLAAALSKAKPRGGTTDVIFIHPTMYPLLCVATPHFLAPLSLWLVDRFADMAFVKEIAQCAATMSIPCFKEMAEGIDPSVVNVLALVGGVVLVRSVLSVLASVFTTFLRPGKDLKKYGAWAVVTGATGERDERERDSALVRTIETMAAGNCGVEDTRRRGQRGSRRRHPIFMRT